MVSSGISANISPIRGVEARIGNTGKTSDADFGKVMTESLAQPASGSNSQSMSSYAAPDMESSRYMKEASSGKSQVQKDKIRKNAKTTENEDNSTVKGAKDNRKENPEVKEASDSIREKIKDEFDVTDEDIENALETLGFTMADLLEEGNLTDFVVELTGMESQVDLLVSSEMTEKVNELFDFIGTVAEDVTKELGISLDELGELLEETDGLAGLEEPEFNSLKENGEVKTEHPALEETKEEESGKKLLDTGKTENSSAAEKDNTVEIRVEKGSTQEFHQDRQNDFSGGSSFGETAGNFVNNLTNAVNEAFEMNGLKETINPVQIIEQIVESAKVILNQETTSMELMLNPENLGKVNLNVSVKAGVVTASIVTQNEAVREAIESQVVLLKENLSGQGIKVEAVEVTVESHAFEAGTGQEQSSAFQEQKEENSKKTGRPLRLDSLKDLLTEDLTEEEKIVLDMMAEEGNQINFKA